MDDGDGSAGGRLAAAVAHNISAATHGTILSGNSAEGAPVAEVGLLPHWGTQDEASLALWIVARPGCLVVLFLAGWAVDVLIFSRFRIDYGTALGLTREEQISNQRLWALVFLSASTLSVFSSLPTLGALYGLLIAYVSLILALAGWLPLPYMKEARWRTPLARALWRCFVPEEGKEIPFVEVLVADGLTSLSKMFFDVAVGSCVAANSVSWWSAGGVSATQRVRRLMADTTVAFGSDAASAAGGTGAFAPGVLAAGAAVQGANATGAAVVAAAIGNPHHQTLLGDALEQCGRSPLPFLGWALPFLIRARQCIMTARYTTDNSTRTLQRINLCKYLSALPIVAFSFSFARSSEHVILFSWLSIEREDFEVWWAVAAVVNAVFSFIWDLVMDWGLLHPGPLRSGSFGLRPVLLFQGIWGFYYAAIVCNLVGRMLWSLRWSSGATLFLGSFYLGSFQQSAEVVRRCLWNVLRVEWECIRKNLHRIDKHFPV